jgi:hypothetical protein
MDASGSGVTAMGLNVAGTCARVQSCWRHRNNWLAWIPAARATSEATAPGSSAAATIRSFSARDQRRRRSTDVTTSTVFVIGVVLVIVLGLARNVHHRKAAVTGRVHSICKELGLQTSKTGNWNYLPAAIQPAPSAAWEFFTDDC